MSSAYRNMNNNMTGPFSSEIQTYESMLLYDEVTWPYFLNNAYLVQECSISSALATEILQSHPKLSPYWPEDLYIH